MKNNERTICGKAKYTYMSKSVVCTKDQGHEGRHDFSQGIFGRRNENGRYEVR